jgi:hypothetical protein
MIADGGVRYVEADPWLAPINEDALTDGHKAKRDKAWTAIRPLVIKQPAIFDLTGGRGS